MNNDEAKKKKDWIAGAVKHPGAFTKKADKAGMTPSAFAKKVTANPSKYSATTRKQANLAKTFGKMRRGK